MYEQILEKISQEVPDTQWVEDNFKSIQEQVEQKSGGLFSVKGSQVILKGTSVPVPEPILTKLMELETKKKPILPLLRFWKKLAQNPSKDSRDDLYTFMQKNNIPITETGDIVTEKGVSQRKGSFVGDLVDDRTGSIDNSVGSYVSMPREEVNANRNQTCSAGLHVAAPDFVRNNWSSQVIIECIVNPKDVVSVPTDYNATKMRVCAYFVAGYSDKSKRDGSKVVSLNDFLDEPIPEVKQVMEEKAQEEQPRKENETTATSEKKPVEETVSDFASDLEGKTAREIVAYVKEHTGVEFTYSLKSKKFIKKKALELLEQNSTTKELEQVESEKNSNKAVVIGEKVVDLSQMGKRDMINFAKEKFNEKFSIITGRQSLKEKVTKLAESAGYKVIQ
ncbi:MAG: hypothetical protein PQJ49_04345 [Sphaerochaetaceae bacterium]|nr:hypothetical protein [Sphaerochaetaceae bacterium]